MATVEVDEDRFIGMLAELKPHLNELQWRLMLGAHARALGRGGISRVAVLAGSHPDTVSRGARELEAGIEPGGRVRLPGAGRPSSEDLDPGLVDALRELVEPETRGDPMQPLRWTTKPTGNLAGELGRAGHAVSADTVGRLLKDRLGYSLQGNAKTIEGKQHPDRDAQFCYINDLVTWCMVAGIPVISIDCKKKELAGNFKNGGAEWEPKGSPRRVNDHDFADRQLGKAAPYGIYDVAANSGWVNVGTDHETAAFAVESIRRWWNSAGSAGYPGARQLLITADCGGSNGNRRRLWKVELARLATELGIEITVVHLPPGASKWNKIEVRHEVPLLTGQGWKTPAAGLSQQAGEAEGSRSAEACGQVGAALTTTGRAGTSRRRGSGKQDETPYERNQCLTSRKGSTGSNLEDMGRVQRTPPSGGDSEAGLSMPVGRPR